MKTRQVLVLVYEQCQILDVSGPVEALKKANDELGEAGYKISLVAAKSGKVETSGVLDLLVENDYDSIDDETIRSLDTLIVVGGNGVMTALNDSALLCLISVAAKKARRVVSVCSGAYLLAELGLLNGRRATTHWESADNFQTQYPEIELEIDAIYTRDGKYWASAGITSGIDLTLALIEEDHGSKVALRVARQLVVYMMRPGGQAQFSSQLKLQRTEDHQLRSLMEWIDDYPDGDLSVANLALQCSMSERNFTRRFTEEVNVTPARFVEQSRLEHSRRKLEETDLSLRQISDQCGFKSVEVMRRLFQRKLGLSPGKYRQRFCTSIRSVSG